MKKDFFHILAGLLIFFPLLAMLEGNFSFWKAMLNFKQKFLPMTFIVSFVSGIIILFNYEE